MIHVAFCTDKNYLKVTSVALISICLNKDFRDSIHFHIVVTDVDESGCEPIRQLIETYGQRVSFYPLSYDRLSDFVCIGSDHVSVTGFARIFLPELLPIEIHRVIYLDGDVMVRHSLNGLWTFPMNDEDPLGAVIDIEGLNPNNRRAVKTPLNIPYCNSGVLLFNLDCWRKEHLTNKVAECARQHSFPLLDQDALHFYFQSRIRILPIRYNTQVGFIGRRVELLYVEYQYLDEIQDAAKDPVVVHFTTHKPWKTSECAFREEWEKYYQVVYSTEIDIAHEHIPFKKTDLCNNLEYLYCMDYELFQKVVPDYIGFYGVVVHMKSRKRIMKVLSVQLSMCTRILEKIYRRNLRKIMK